MTISYFDGLMGVRLNGSPVFVCNVCNKKFQTKGRALHHRCVGGG